MTELYLIRHGANDYTRTHRLAGWTPGVHLNEHGLAQAAALGTHLAQRPLHAIYSSPLERTQETAQAVLVHHPHLALRLLEAVGEVRYGEWTGAELGKLAQTRLWRHVQATPSRVRFPGGEAMREAQLRAVEGIESVVLDHPRQTVAIVSHSDIIKMIVAHYLGLHLDLFQRITIAPASLTILQLRSGAAQLELLNETGYLPQETPPAAPNP